MAGSFLVLESARRGVWWLADSTCSNTRGENVKQGGWGNGMLVPQTQISGLRREPRLTDVTDVCIEWTFDPGPQVSILRVAVGLYADALPDQQSELLRHVDGKSRWC